MRCLHELIDLQVRQSPEAVAVVFQDEYLTYRELDQKANQVAGYLRQMDIQPEMLVGLNVKPSIEIIVGMLGILKAGGAFVPLDPNYPADLLSYMLADTNMSVILTTSESAPGLPRHNARLIYLDELTDDVADAGPPNNIDPHHAACCLYTSGSTGNPKGVLLEHQALVSNCSSLQKAYHLTADDRILQFAPLNHIAGLEQVIIALVTGARLVLREPGLWTANEFPARIKEYGLTVLDLPAGYYQVLLESWIHMKSSFQDTSLRLIIVGGEAVSVDMVVLWQKMQLPEVRFLNVYGMTELSGTATFFEIAGQISERVPIGRPLEGRTAYVLDDQLQPVATGDTGVLYVGGASLAREYLNQPDLTETHFIPDPFSKDDGAMLFKTGELAGYLPDGMIDYLGRIDHQVQIRGFRVELGEIETTLRQHAAVNEAAVITHGEGTTKRLVAYVVPQTGELTATIKDLWEPGPQFRYEAGVITDPTERMAFKLKQHNLRPASGSGVQLKKPLMDDNFHQRYLARQSYRQFTNKPISFEQFSHLLSCLLQLNLPDTPIPKYRYPSALGLYPVQTYLFIKSGQVEGVESGFYYYHPVDHKLQLLQKGGEMTPMNYMPFEKPMYEQSGFALFLIAHLDASAPLYGQKLALEFCMLEAGYIGQLLMTEAPDYNLGLCPIGSVKYFDDFKDSLRLKDDQVLIHSFLGGMIESSQKKQWLQHTSSQKSPAQLKTELHTYMAQKLPLHMIPDTFVLMETMPLTPNGKIDRRALPVPEAAGPGNSTNFVSPGTPTEKTVAEIWMKVLKLERVGIKDDFFELGGNSLSALQLLTGIQQTFQIDLPLNVLLQRNTIADLAARIEALKKVREKYSDGPDSEYEEGVL